MKTKLALVISLSAIFGWLFYQQGIGMNMGIFCMLLLTLVSLLRKQYDTLGVVLLGGAAVASMASIYYGSWLATLACYFSTIVACSYVGYKTTHPTHTFLNGLRLQIAGLVYMLSDLFEPRVPGVQQSRGKRTWGFLLVISASIIVCMVFLRLYKASNEQFASIIESIDLSFISLGWLFTMVAGFILVYGFFYPREPLKIGADATAREMTRWITLRMKLQFTTMTVSILSIMLALFLFTELDSSILVKEPSGARTYSSEVHQSIETLIISVVLVIAMILLMFRSTLLRFLPDFLQRLTVAWLVLNLAVVLTSAIKNYLYITEWGLTYKRIGVFVFLLVVSVGLIASILKLVNKQANLPVFNKLLATGYTVLVGTALIPWDSWIAHYNVEKAIEKQSRDPLAYAADLSVSSALIVQGKRKELGDLMDEDVERLVEEEIYLFKRRYEQSDFQSLSWSDIRAYRSM